MRRLHWNGRAGPTLTFCILLHFPSWIREHAVMLAAGSRNSAKCKGAGNAWINGVSAQQRQRPPGFARDWRVSPLEGGQPIDYSAPSLSSSPTCDIVPCCVWGLPIDRIPRALEALSYLSPDPKRIEEQRRWEGQISESYASYRRCKKQMLYQGRKWYLPPPIPNLMPLACCGYLLHLVSLFDLPRAEIGSVLVPSIVPVAWGVFACFKSKNATNTFSKIIQLCFVRIPCKPFSIAVLQTNR